MSTPTPSVRLPENHPRGRSRRRGNTPGRGRGRGIRVDASNSTCSIDSWSPGAVHASFFNEATPALSQPGSSHAKQRRGEIPCKTWKKDGNCPRGNKCWFGHDPQVLEDKRRHEERQRAETERRRQEAERRRQAQEEQENRRREDEARQREEVEMRRQVAERLRQEQEEQENRRREEAERWQRRQEELLQERKRQEEEAAMELQKAQRAEEAAYTIQTVMLNSTVVTFAAGIAVQDVMTGFQSCRIWIKNLPRNVREKEIYDLFLQQGIERTRIHIVGLTTKGRLKPNADVLCDAEAGRAMAIGLDGIDFRGEKLEFEVKNANINGMGSATKGPSNELTITWHAPSSTWVAEYGDKQVAEAKVRELNGKWVETRKIKVEMNRPPQGHALLHFNPNSIKILGLPVDIDMLRVYEFAGTFQVRCLHKAQYDTTGAFLHLRATIENISHITSFETPPSQNTDGRLIVKARFKDWDDANKVQSHLEGKRFDWMGRSNIQCRLPAPHRYLLSIFPEQYAAQKQLWNSLASSNDDKTCALRVHNDDRTQKVSIQVIGGDEKAVGSLKVRVESLAAGQRVDSWHRSLALGDRSTRLLREIGEDSGTFIRYDWRVKALKVYGGAQNVMTALERVKAEVERLGSLEHTVTLAQRSIGFFLRRGLEELQEMFGPEAATLDVRSRRITVSGGEEAHHALQTLIKQSMRADAGATRPEEQNDAICPICYDAVSSPIQLACDHFYCTACFRHFLTTAADGKTFPLVCIGDETRCRAPIPIPVIQRFLTPQQFDHLLEVAFTTYVERNSAEIKYCPTPDCTQLYRCDPSSASSELQCPSCFFAICSACGLEAHTGMTCHERKVGAEQLTDRWAELHDARRCPSCAVLIQKAAGCNHMTCSVCRSHICWKCMNVFEVDTIYNHMTEAHGGYGQDEGIDPQGAEDIPEVYHPIAGGVGWGEAVNVQEQERMFRNFAALQRLRDEEQQMRAARQRELLTYRREQEEEFRRRQEQVRQQELRNAQFRLREQQEHARQQELRNAQFRLRQQQERQRREQESGGGWCIVM